MIYKQRLEEIEKKLPETSKAEYFVLSSEYEKREIYFINTKESIKFMQTNTYSFKKKILAFLLKLNIIQPFLKKAMLDRGFGDVISIANSIKCFYIKGGWLRSFPLSDEKTSEFLRILRMREQFQEFSPMIFKTDYSIPYYDEEMLERYGGGMDIPLQKLKEFNEKTGLIHGDFVPSHIMADGNSVVFIDWDDVREGKYEEDLEYFKQHDKI